MKLIFLVFAIVFFFAPIVVALVAIARTKRLKLKIEILADKISRIEQSPTATSDAPDSAPKPLPEAPPTAQTVEIPTGPSLTDPPKGTFAWGDETIGKPKEQPRPQTPPSGETLEQKLASRWMIWLGGFTIALGAGFMVKYSIDAGLLGPAMRCTVGLLIGMALIGLGEWQRRSPMAQVLAAISPSQVPPALSAAGIVALYSAIYAAYDLYGLIAPMTAFVGLAIVSTLSVGLSLLHGRLIGALGILGGFAVPALVSTGNPSALTLFPYLLYLVGGSMAVVRYKGWWWLGALALTGGLAWAALWINTMWKPGDGAAVHLYLIAVLALTIFIRHGWRTPEPSTLKVGDVLFGLSPADRIVWAAGLAVPILAVAVVRMDHYAVGPLVLFGILVALMLFAGRREATFDLFGPFALLMTIALIATWHASQLITTGEAPLNAVPGRGLLFNGPIIPPSLTAFTSASAGYALLFAAGGFAALWGAWRPAVWAGVSVGTPVILLAVAFWRIEGIAVHMGWAGIGLAVAVFAVGATALCERHRANPRMNEALGAYAVGMIAAVCLALGMGLETSWLTVALALQLPALAWLERKLTLPAMRTVAIILTGIILVRLIGDRAVFGFFEYKTSGAIWILYGYGVPAAAAYWASKMFAKANSESEADWTVMILEAAALTFLVTLISLEIHELLKNAASYSHMRLMESALDALSRLALAYGLLRAERVASGPVRLWGWRILLTVGTLQVLLFNGVLYNPWDTRSAFLDWPIINVLILAFAAPAAFGLAFADRFARADYRRLTTLSGVIGLGLGLLYLTLETSRAFRGSNMSVGSASDPEWYAYSVVWLIYAGLVLMVALWRRWPAARHAALAILTLTVLKVFLSDMSALTGLLRALSFLGLGGCLIGIGYLYQRFVFKPQNSSKPADSPASG